MTEITRRPSSLNDESAAKYFNDYYNGKIKCSCCEGCPDNCQRDHYYELVDYIDIFKD